MRTSNTNNEPLACSADELAQRLGISVRHLRRMDASGLLPSPVRLGRSVRWPVAEIDEWLAAGAPDRKTWTKQKQSLSRDRRKG